MFGSEFSDDKTVAVEEKSYVVKLTLLFPNI